jgi:hypothetical protein
MSANITLPPQEHFLSVQHVHVDTAIADAILTKGTRGSFRQWDKKDYDLAVTRLQMPHGEGGFGLTPNTIAQTSTKVAMVSWFLGLVGSLSLDEKNLWFPNQLVHDPDTWTVPHLLQLKREYEILEDKYGCIVQEMFTVHRSGHVQGVLFVDLFQDDLRCLFSPHHVNHGGVQKAPAKVSLYKSHTTEEPLRRRRSGRYCRVLSKSFGSSRETRVDAASTTSEGL